MRKINLIIVIVAVIASSCNSNKERQSIVKKLDSLSISIDKHILDLETNAINKKVDEVLDEIKPQYELVKSSEILKQDTFVNSDNYYVVIAHEALSKYKESIKVQLKQEFEDSKKQIVTLKENIDAGSIADSLMLKYYKDEKEVYERIESSMNTILTKNENVINHYHKKKESIEEFLKILKEEDLH